MQNKTALVTGGSRGIGKAICLELAQQGYNILINYSKSEKEAKDLQDKIKKFNVKVEICKADLTSEEECLNLYKFALENFKTIDILINNAGVCFDMNLADRTVSHFTKTFKTNVFAPFFLSKLFGDCMVENRFGKIINISSNNSINCFYPTSIDYDCSKSALNTLTKDLAIQFAPYVNVNAIAPGWIETDMNKDLDKDIMEFEKTRILKNRIGKPEDVAKLVSFLVSENADYINGEIIVIDGGMFN